MNPKRQIFLKKLKHYGEEKNIPNISEQNAQFLHFLIRLKKASSVLEIGTANGYSTIWLADAIEDKPHKRYLGIEISEPSYKQAVKNIKAQNLDNFVELQWGNALQILPRVNEKFDIVFLDAQKALYGDFWNTIKPLLHKDSLVIVDDMIKFPKKTDGFLKQIEQEKHFKHILIPMDEDDGVMLVKRF